MRDDGSLRNRKSRWPATTTTLAKADQGKKLGSDRMSKVEYGDEGGSAVAVAGNEGNVKVGRRVRFGDVADDGPLKGSDTLGEDECSHYPSGQRKIALGSPTARIIQKELLGGQGPLRRSNSLPSLFPGVRKLLLKQSRRSPSANIIKKEFRHASLRKVDEESRRQTHVPLVSSKGHILDPDLYKALLRHSKRSASANVIKKEFRYASLKTVDEESRRRRSEPLISTKDLLLDPDVYELLLARSRRSPSANIIKKEFRYACLRKVNRAGDCDYDDASSISTMLSHFHGFDEYDDDERGLYVYDWLIDLEPIMPEPSLFPYYEPATFSHGGRRMSGSTLATSVQSVVSEESQQGNFH